MFSNASFKRYQIQGFFSNNFPQAQIEDLPSACCKSTAVDISVSVLFVVKNDSCGDSQGGDAAVKATGSALGTSIPTCCLCFITVINVSFKSTSNCSWACSPIWFTYSTAASSAAVRLVWRCFISSTSDLTSFKAAASRSFWRANLCSRSFNPLTVIAYSWPWSD